MVWCFTDIIIIRSVSRYKICKRVLSQSLKKLSSMQHDPTYISSSMKYSCSYCHSYCRIGSNNLSLTELQTDVLTRTFILTTHAFTRNSLTYSSSIMQQVIFANRIRNVWGMIDKLATWDLQPRASRDFCDSARSQLMSVSFLYHVQIVSNKNFLMSLK